LQIEALARASRQVIELLESNKMALELAAKQQTAYPDNSHQIVSELVDEILRTNGWWAARAYWAEEGQLHPQPWRFDSAAPLSIRSLSDPTFVSTSIDDGLRFPKPVLLSVDNVSWLGDNDQLRRAGVRNVVVTDVAGVLSFALRLVFVVPNTQALTSDILASLSTASLLLPKVIRQERARGELHYRATHDSLTGLLNRRGLEQVVEPIEQSRSSGIHAVIYLDVDRFKNVNDTHGHEVGDEVLSHVASHLVKQIRPTDVLARLGGDEFVVLALNVDNQTGAYAAADRILNYVNGAFNSKSGAQVSVSVSLGVALWSSGDSFQNALRLSDALMYRAKQQGGGVVREEPTNEQLPQANQIQVESSEQEPKVELSPIIFYPSSKVSGTLATIQSTLRNPDSKRIAQRISSALAVSSMSAGSEQVVLDFPNHFWSHEDLIQNIVGELKALGGPQVLVVSLDCSLANPTVRQVASLLKQRSRVEVLLTNFGSGPNELLLLDQLEPMGLGLSKDAVASLGTLEPRATNLKTAIAIAAALDLQTFGFDLNSESQAQQLGQLGCNQVVFAKSVNQQGNQ
jgi:diguanylate cyclase (GGDEF)-like protein